mmetsp:Transcript_6959/g.14892  ORF Transcript_6959/g.14892 Transcript_6959/m.14892 type:complete len:237 (+) Transcript_6959:2343-3053(+)
MLLRDASASCWTKAWICPCCTPPRTLVSCDAAASAAEETEPTRASTAPAGTRLGRISSANRSEARSSPSKLPLGSASPRPTTPRSFGTASGSPPASSSASTTPCATGTTPTSGPPAWPTAWPQCPFTCLRGSWRWLLTRSSWRDRSIASVRARARPWGPRATARRRSSPVISAGRCAATSGAAGTTAAGPSACPEWPCSTGTALRCGSRTPRPRTSWSSSRGSRSARPLWPVRTVA